MRRHSIALFAAMISIAAIGLGPAACEAEALPKPTGPHSVGRITVHFVDAARDDDQGTHKDGKREFMAHVWYPAEPGTAGKPAPWMPSEWARLEKKAF